MSLSKIMIEIVQETPHFNEIFQLIRDSKEKMYQAINVQLIDLYWNLGEYLFKMVREEGWGRSVVSNLAKFLKEKDHTLKGFSMQNLWRMKQFFEYYQAHEKLSPLVREISWTNNLIILSKTKCPEEMEFYLRLSINERYSKRELERQIDSGLYERWVLSDRTIEHTSITPETRPVMIKDAYILDFLDLPQTYSERDLQDAILNDLKLFLLETGKDLSLVGENYRLQVGNHDYYIDLLFFHRGLSCFVVFELKIDDFKPEYVGKMNFYLEAIDREMTKASENPSVGVILCKGKDNDVVEYAMSRNISPTLVAEYRTKLIPKEQLEQRLKEFTERLDE